MAKTIKPLTPSQVQNAKPKDVAYKLRDGNGLNRPRFRRQPSAA